MIAREVRRLLLRASAAPANPLSCAPEKLRMHRTEEQGPNTGAKVPNGNLGERVKSR